jgi:hypothetical protein
VTFALCLSLPRSVRQKLPVHNRIRFRLFCLSKPQAAEALQYYRAHAEVRTLKPILRRLDTASVREPREKLELQFRCCIADYDGLFPSPTAAER